MLKTKTLLVFAHRGEAQSFIERLHLQHKENIFFKSFENEDFFLLLTGEGVQEATRILTTYLAQNLQSIKQVVNFGIAGSLNQRLKVGDVSPVRSVCRQGSQGMEFKSFTLCDLGFDCITSDLRVLNSEQANFLNSFGDLIDRELWAIAEVCHFFKVPLRSFKAISDQPVHEKQSIQCQWISERASHWSEKLFEYYQMEVKALPQRDSEEATTMPILDLFIEGIVKELNHKSQKKSVTSQWFHWTQTLRHQMDQLLELRWQQSKNLEKIKNEINFEVLLEKNLTSKVRAMRLLRQLQVISDPIFYQIQNQIEKSLKGLTDEQVHVQYSDQLEDPTLTISFQFKNELEFDSKIKKISQFNPRSYFKIFEGEINV